ncbi:ferritin-like domain-containing protein [Sediminicola sp. 1XM1-17]|uniref:ferritin-like domain-containing protein n=1 Tax=Sediminicola sp. 1XM1-17 TaxID=3127702 RepID=UPI003077D235
METTNDKVYKEIREILEKNRDAEKGYAKAADKAESAALKSYFRRKSTERRDFNAKLVGEIQTAYPDFDANGSFAGNIHRAWMDVKALFSMDNDEAMLEEAIRGDKAAIDEYDDVLDKYNLPTGLRFLLSEQRENIQMEVAQNKTLEDLA